MSKRRIEISVGEYLFPFIQIGMIKQNRPEQIAAYEELLKQQEVGA